MVSHKIQAAGAPAAGGLEEGERNIPGNAAWHNVPLVSWNAEDRKAKLNADNCGNANRNWAVRGNIFAGLFISLQIFWVIILGLLYIRTR